MRRLRTLPCSWAASLVTTPSLRLCINHDLVAGDRSFKLVHAPCLRKPRGGALFIGRADDPTILLFVFRPAQQMLMREPRSELTASRLLQQFEDGAAEKQKEE